MLLGLCLSTAMTLDAPCGTEPLLLLPQRLTPGTVPESELGYNECFCCGGVWDSGAREQTPRPHSLLDCIITKLLRLSPGKTDCFISKGQRVVWPEMREESNHTSRDPAGGLDFVPGKAG